MGDDAFSGLMASADPPVVVVTTSADGRWAGCLVGFHGQSSIDPQHYCLWLSKANHTYRVGLEAQRFAVHFLTVDDRALAERFGGVSGEDTDKFAGLDVTDEEYGVPLLAVPNLLVGDRIAQVDDGGDHVCLTTRVLTARTAGPFEPLRVSAVADLTPGHEADERAISP